MNTIETEVLRGKITIYNDKTGWGIVKTTYGCESFFCGWFSSGRPQRGPHQGEEVDVVFCRKKLVGLRAVS